MHTPVIASLAAALPAPTAIHQIISPDHGVEPRGNATVMRRRYTVAGWRRLSTELDPARCGLDARRAAALLHAMRHLDAVLENPIRVYVDGRERVVELLGVFRYFADLDTRRLQAGRFLRDGSFARWTDDRPFALFPAMHGDYWLPWLLDVSGLDWRTQRYPHDDVDSWRPHDAIERRFVAILRRMIDADRRFRAMRVDVAARLVGADVLAIAVRACTWRPYRALTLSALQHAWRNFACYAEVARQAPRLLPLVPLAFGPRDLRIRPAEILQLLRTAVTKGSPHPGIGDAAWRWLLEHGVRGLQHVVEQPWGHDSIDDVHRLLEAMRDAGWPVSPAPRFWRMWSGFNRHVRAQPAIEIEDWCRWNQVPSRLLRLLAKEADERRDQPDFAAWCDETGDALQALVDPRLGGAPRLGHSRFARAIPRRPDRGWFQRTAAQRKAEIAILASSDPCRWDDFLGERSYGSLTAVPLVTSHALFDEGRAMHHCVLDYAKDCTAGVARVYALRSKEGRRVATVAIEPCLPDGGWRVLEVRGPANQAPCPEARLAARRIADDYGKAQRLVDAALGALDPTERETASGIADDAATERYEVYVLDNFEAPHPRAGGSAIRFDSAEAALAFARRIVDEFVDENVEACASVDDLRRRFTMFGETPIITPIRPGLAAPSFSSIDHLMSRAAALFGSNE